MYTGPNIVTNGLVLELDAANNKSYPGSGTTWFDKSGNNIIGSLNGGAVLSNNFITFSNGYITLSAKNISSMCFLMQKNDPSDGAWRYFLDTRSSGYSCYIATNAIANASNFYINAIPVSVSWNSIPTDQWFYFYFNVYTSISGTINILSRFSNVEFLPAKISNIQAYNRTLSQQEIAQNYNALKYRFIP